MRKYLFHYSLLMLFSCTQTDLITDPKKLDGIIDRYVSEDFFFPFLLCQARGSKWRSYV